MFVSRFTKSLLVAGLLFTSSANAQDIPQAVSKLALELGIPATNIRPTPANGLYELLVGTQIFYITADAKYLLAGSMLNMQTKENLTDTRMKGVRLDALEGLAEDQYISFKAKDPVHTVTVFTDIDCGYCRKLHSEMEQYNKFGITVNYLFYPRTGPGTASYNKAISVWCNKDRNNAMTVAKAGKDLEAAKCSNPVGSHFQLGTQLGLSGTPFMITEYGDTLPGYLPPAALKRELDKLQAAASVSGHVKPADKKSVSKR